MTEYNDELQMFWTWVKQHSRFVTDQDLGVLRRILAGQDPHAGDDVRSM